MHQDAEQSISISLHGNRLQVPEKAPWLGYDGKWLPTQMSMTQKCPRGMAHRALFGSEHQRRSRPSITGTA